MASFDPSGSNGNGRRAYFTPTISLGNVLVIIGMVVGGVWALGGIKSDIAVLQTQMMIVMNAVGIGDADHRPRASGGEHRP